MRTSTVLFTLVLLTAGCGGAENSGSAQADDSTSADAAIPTTIAIGDIDDLPEEAISLDPDTGEIVIEVGTVADLGGHAEAIEAAPAGAAAHHSPIAALWVEIGADPELAQCYAELFDQNGWAAANEQELSELQAKFTPEQAEEFATC